MKIGHIILTSQNGGAERVFIDYITILKKIGHQNYALIKSDAPYSVELDKMAIDYIKINNNFGYIDVFAVKKINDFIVKNNLDIIIAHAGKSMVLARKAIDKAQKNKGNNYKKIILVAVNHSNNIKRSLVADLIFSINREIFYKTIDAKRTPENSMILYNGIELPEQKPTFTNHNFLAQEIINLGVIGRFHKAKGFDIMLEAFKIIKDKTKLNIKLKIAGDGEESSALHQKVKDLQLENNVEFMGWVANPQDFFCHIDIFILPSRSETFGLVILEAMKYGKPIIATKCDGPQEILREDKDALLVDLNPPQNTASNIANAVEKMIFDKELADNLVKNAYQRLENRFSQKILAENLAEIFKI